MRILYCVCSGVHKRIQSHNVHLNIGVHIFYGERPNLLLRSGSRATREKKITLSFIPNCINYSEIFIVYTQFTNVAAGRIIQRGEPRVVDP